MPDLSPDAIDWYRERSFDAGSTRVRLTISRRQALQLAHFIPEATSIEEAIRMAVSQGAWVLQQDPNARVSNPDVPGVESEPNAAWSDQIPTEGSLEVRPQLTEECVRRLARVAGHAPSIQEAVRLVMNVALAARAGE